jgi:tetratricopeptide (TPR) repeat protein
MEDGRLRFTRLDVPRLRSLLAPLLLLLSLLAPAVAAAGPSEALEPFSRGKDLLQRGDAIGAEAQLRKAAAADPADPEIRLALANCLSTRIAGYAEAEKEYRLALEGAAKNHRTGSASTGQRAAAGLGRLLVKTGKPRDAIPVLKAALNGAGSQPVDDLRAVLALAYYEERLYDEAILELRTATRSNPRNSTALFNLKTLRTRLEPYQAGKIYARVANHEGAIQQFRKAIQYDPRFIGARLHLGMELMQAGKTEEALRELHRAESISPTYPNLWEIWYAQGQALAALRRNGEALAKYQSVVDRRPKFAPAQFEMGLVLESDNKLAEAAARYALAIEGDPRTDYVRRLQSILNRLGSAPSTLPPVKSSKGL